MYLLKCYLCIICLVVSVISICKSVNLTCDCFLHKSHYMSKSTLCVSIAMHLIFVRVFACQTSKTCKKLCQNYTLLLGGTRPSKVSVFLKTRSRDRVQSTLPWGVETQKIGDLFSRFWALGTGTQGHFILGAGLRADRNSQNLGQ